MNESHKDYARCQKSLAEARDELAKLPKPPKCDVPTSQTCEVGCVVSTSASRSALAPHTKYTRGDSYEEEMEKSDRGEAVSVKKGVNVPKPPKYTRGDSYEEELEKSGRGKIVSVQKGVNVIKAR